jgi:hypothetical protein
MLSCAGRTRRLNAGGTPAPQQRAMVQLGGAGPPKVKGVSGPQLAGARLGGGGEPGVSSDDSRAFCSSRGRLLHLGVLEVDAE